MNATYAMNTKYQETKSELRDIINGMRQGTSPSNAIECIIGKGEWSEDHGMNIYPEPIGKAQQNILGRVLATGDNERLSRHQKSIDNSIEIIAVYIMALSL